MTATNSTEPAKDGSGNAFNITFANESVSGNKAQKTYIGEPVGETLITPAQDGTDGTGITPPTGAVGIRGWLSGIFNKLNTSIGVTGTFWQTTQPISVASLPLPTGAATAAGVATVNTTLGTPMQATGGSVTANAGTNLNTSLLALETGGNLASIKTNTAITAAGVTASSGSGVQGMTGGVALPVSGTFWQATQPVSAASLPLPSGAATAAGLTTINTTLGTPMQATGGTVTANAGTNLNTSALALETGGNLASIKTNTALTLAGVTATSGQGVQGMTGGVALPVSGTFWQATQPISAASLPLPTGASTSANQPTVAAQGSTTAGQTGHLIEGAVTTAAPTYTTAQTSPLSLDTSGNLRVSVISGGAAGNVAQGSTTASNTGPMSQGAVTTSAPTYTTGQTDPLSLNTSGGLRVDGSGATQPISAASLPLPAGAATAAGLTTINTTLGSPMQTTGGTVTANAGTNLNTSALALETGGNLATVATAQGASGTGITQPTGGSGILGWLSGCYSTLLSILTSVTGSIPAGSAIIGKVGIDQTTPGTTNAVAIANIPTITPFSTNSVTTSAAAIAAHISATAGQYGYLSGVTISGLGATATSAINCNIQGLIGGTRQFWIQIPAGVAVALNPIQLSWNPPVQSSAVNTLIQCNVPSFGTGNVEASVVMDGYTSTSAQPLP